MLAMCRSELFSVIARLCLSVCEMGGTFSEELIKCPSPSPAVLWFFNVSEIKPTLKRQGNNRNTRKRSEICSKLTAKAPQWS